MTPQEKADELHVGYWRLTNDLRIAKKCALVAAQEIICSNPHSNPLNTDVTSTMKWWMEVQEEIEKL